MTNKKLFILPALLLAVIFSVASATYAKTNVACDQTIAKYKCCCEKCDCQSCKCNENCCQNCCK